MHRSTELPHTLWWGGCAWDSFALPHLLKDERDVLVATRCPACDTPHAWVVGREAPPVGDQVAHFLTPMSRAWDDVVHTSVCSATATVSTPGCAGRGRSADTSWIWPRCGALRVTGTRARDPAAAASYFAEVGLHGSFWGLPE
ncbi:organomercurial lyase [Streptomyces sp. NPDC056390]|uniref:organomercurial lyase n=1 Tax=Streptomyces sp. NPDC056390 TaxID=3345806 RepID=UPI0035E01B48